MRRRTFLKATAAMLLPRALCGSRWASAAPSSFDPAPGTWRTFEITTRIEVLRPGGGARVWAPVPAVTAEYQTPLGNQWSGNATSVRMITDGIHGATMLYGEFPDSEVTPRIELTSRVRTQDRAIEWSNTVRATENRAGLAIWTRSTTSLPIDGIVRRTALEITRGKRTDVDKVRAVYDWILANTYREPTVRGCGTGDIQRMLETRSFGGKCADINALFVGLLRAVDVPARDVYGIRVAPSAFGFRSLGAGTSNVTKAQHCRAEVHLRNYGWVAMDPADVAKVAREETSEWLKIDDPLVRTVRPKLFGGWEGNWVGYNVAHDVALPNATHPTRIPFLMYPQSETGSGWADSLDADGFKYAIEAREIAV